MVPARSFDSFLHSRGRPLMSKSQPIMGSIGLESPYAARPWLDHYDYWVRPHMNYPREILVIAQDSGMRALLTLDVLAPAVLAVREQTKIENTIITSLAEYSLAATPPAAIEGTLRLADLLAEVAEPDLPRVEIDTE